MLIFYYYNTPFQLLPLAFRHMPALFICQYAKAMKSDDADCEFFARSLSQQLLIHYSFSPGRQLASPTIRPFFRATLIFPPNTIRNAILFGLAGTKQHGRHATMPGMHAPRNIFFQLVYSFITFDTLLLALLRQAFQLPLIFPGRQYYC